MIVRESMSIKHTSIFYLYLSSIDSTSSVVYKPERSSLARTFCHYVSEFSYRLFTK
jgi:hypothetical protein